MTITCRGCEAFIENDLAEDPRYQSCIDCNSDCRDKETYNHYVMADDEEVSSLASKELNLSIFCMPSLDFHIIDHFVDFSVWWSFLH
jgi:hypothetical protein